MRSVLTFLTFWILCYLPALSGIFFRPGEWYQQLNKPTWTPPNWLFGPVWTLLYFSIAVSGFMVWRKIEKEQRLKAYLPFAAHLILNAIWSYLFFGINEVGFAFAEICVLWITILINIVMFAKIFRPAAFILIPYALWVAFAAALNFAIVSMN
ncbi:TspO/MBR family protein [Candidatus Uabimicrobium amorphum]|uniref:Sensory protein TspO n=1 Tax=Uabimicrobium amorphum TaxID=2596890 RepID=A0A5S9F393_UABAM|nr:TspO/MBR family protein [Candidatus Uabimicrobium amorphum]BBM84272.1 sensory protein TspO [Candidatus Uabimicrobium amorphum]